MSRRRRSRPSQVDGAPSDTGAAGETVPLEPEHVEPAPGEQQRPAAPEEAGFQGLLPTGSPAEFASRRLDVHVYLPQCVVLGSIYVAGDSLSAFLNVAGKYLRIHQAMWVPYREGVSPKRSREAVVHKEEVLFVVHRPDHASPLRPRDELRAVELLAGPFSLHGWAAQDESRTAHAVMVSDQRFFELQNAAIDGPLGATFTEPVVVVHTNRVSLLTIA